MILALLLVVSAPAAHPAPATAQASAPSANAPAQAAADAEPPRRTCRMVRITGSRLGGRRVCRTEQERDESAERNQDAAREMQRDSAGNAEVMPMGTSR